MAAEGESDARPSDELGSPDDDRGAPTVEESIAKAETGTEIDDVHTASLPGDSGERRREEIREVDGATTGTVEHGPSPAQETRPQPGPSPTDIGSGGAQRIEGARISDRVAAGQPVPDGPPFAEKADKDYSAGGPGE